jgi:hypothetical protein
MQTVEWTDGKLEERLDRVDERFQVIDDRFKGVDRRFDEVDRRIGETRGEMKERFDRVEGDIHDLKEGDIRELKQGLASVQTSFNRFVIGAATGWVVLMVTILAKGA